MSQEKSAFKYEKNLMDYWTIIALSKKCNVVVHKIYEAAENKHYFVMFVEDISSKGRRFIAKKELSVDMVKMIVYGSAFNRIRTNLRPMDKEQLVRL